MLRLLAHHDGTREQTLLEHSEQVAELCGRTCRAIRLGKLGELIGRLHDMGKATLVFQNYLRSGDLSLRGTINHSSCGARYIALLTADQVNNNLARLTCELATLCICSHHSGLADSLDPSGKYVLGNRITPEKDIYYEEAVSSFTSQCFSEEVILKLFNEACAEVGEYIKKVNKYCSSGLDKSAGKQFQFMVGLTARFLHSALIDADRYDTYLFLYDQKVAPDQDLKSLWNRLASKLEDYCKEFILNGPIDRIRSRISLDCYRFATMAAGVYRLNVPTGGGKTISSLRFSVNHAMEHSMRHVFYVAPYKVILEQSAQTFRDALDHDDLILEHHSDVVPDDGKNFGDEWDRYRLLTERWQSPIILTTMVQMLQTFYSNRSACARRFHELESSIIIMDEIQSLPVKFVSMTNTLINFLTGILGCTVILCTATQPELTQVPIRLKLSEPRDIIKRELGQLPEFRRTNIVDLTDQREFSAEGVAQLCMDKLSEEGQTNSILAIFNTKNAAQKVYESLNCMAGRVKVYYLSTRLCPAHRMDILEKVKADLNAELPVICVSTQLIEAGVDISFSCVIRSLAGLSSIAQAAGRCNRNRKSEIPKGVYIIKSQNEDLTNLRDIVLEQEAVKPLLESYRKNPEKYDHDLLSHTAIKAYYQHYYHDRVEELNYKATEKDASTIYELTSVYDLLSSNPSARRACMERGLKAPDILLHQAFDTAGSIVKVIEGAGTGVIVPYEEGKEIIARLEGTIDEKSVPLELRKAQRYTVNLNSSEKKRLESCALVPVAGGKALALRSRFYDKELGVVMEPTTDEAGNFIV